MSRAGWWRLAGPEGVFEPIKIFSSCVCQTLRRTNCGGCKCEWVILSSTSLTVLRNVLLRHNRHNRHNPYFKSRYFPLMQTVISHIYKHVSLEYRHQKETLALPSQPHQRLFSHGRLDKTFAWSSIFLVTASAPTCPTHWGSFSIIFLFVGPDLVNLHLWLSNCAAGWFYHSGVVGQLGDTELKGSAGIGHTGVIAYPTPWGRERAGLSFPMMSPVLNYSVMKCPLLSPACHKVPETEQRGQRPPSDKSKPILLLVR